MKHIFLLLLLSAILSGCIFGKKKATRPIQPIEDDIYIVPPDTTLLVVQYSSLQLRYATALSVTPDLIQNQTLYQFIDKWMHTPYKWGGADEDGIDCSAFIQRLLGEVYDIHIPRTSVLQFYTERIERFRGKRHLSEGDLIFFRTDQSKLISHVGFYLHNNIFVNSSANKGVSLANLQDPYWKSRYVAAGRVKASLAASGNDP